ncbi:MAG: type II secretion system F family protein [Vampirovibrionales bacterium]|nr:type II secretion system F family protein [Vampirovibrionales bacterium]
MEIVVLIVGIVLTVFLLALGLKHNKDGKQVEERLSALNKQDAPKSTLIRKRQLESSFNERVLFPAAQLVFDKTQQIIPLSNKSWVKAKLIQAGYQKPHYPKIFLGIQLLCTGMMFGVVLAFTALFGAKFGGVVSVVISAVFGLIGYGLPMIWLIQQAGKRQGSIQKSLADFLDLLVICVEAGLGLDTAITKIATMKSVKTSVYLREELNVYCKDVGFGKPRKQALLDLAERTGVDDLNAIINAIVQAYEMGTGVAHTLRVQADSLRVKRLTKAEETANKIPVKMVLPIYIFLFPAIFVSIFGPISIVMIEAIMSIFGGMNSVGG